MKRLRSSDDLDSYGKDPNPNPNPNPSRTSSSTSHRSFYYKPDTVRKGLLSSSSSASSLAPARSYDDRDSAGAGGGSRTARKRQEQEFDGFDRRKGLDRYNRDGGGYDRSSMHRSESFSVSRRSPAEFPKGFRSERDRPRREGSGALSWRRFGKEFEDRGGKGLRDVRSPTWSNSRDSGSEQSRVRSPVRRFRDGKGSKSESKSKSPTWSKDSVGSEQSKSVEVRKRETEEIQVESGSRASSEMEEGGAEMEEAQDRTGSDTDTNRVKKGVPLDEDEVREEKGESLDEEENREEKGESLDEEEVKAVSKENMCERKDEEKKDEGLPNSENDMTDEARNMEGHEDRDGEKESFREGNECKEEVSKGVVVERSMELEEGPKQDKGIDLEVKAEDDDDDDDEITESDKEVTEEEEENEVVKLDMVDASVGLSQNFKDKGKSVAVAPAHVVDSAEDGGWNARESRELLTCMDNDMEGPSTRGFELFSTSPVRRQEKADHSGVSMKDEKLALEPLDLSLSLPNVLLPIGAALVLLIKQGVFSL
ncbi:protein OBERON 4 [Prunus yedoensis var. nudiflora]|uniref:Protein OBERON 4 n=1 Tax=Prunus yedoensis var. nudiflora TaxID=2094558 RepID=A0A314ZAS9_PRUYE|nr:protein OBERON 4 [Prunus yedoensis var. nudiflora]